jgi:hypothetical protein
MYHPYIQNNRKKGTVIMKKKMFAAILVFILLFNLAACSKKNDDQKESESQTDEDTGESTQTESESGSTTQPESNDTAQEENGNIEETLNLANNAAQEWSYTKESDAWVLSVVPAVAYPEIATQQGVSVCVPGVFVTGIDTNGDQTEDITAATYQEAVQGSLVIDYNAKITSTNGQVYTAKTAPVILNTGAAGYGSAENTAASTLYAAEGYINIACGNRGKQDTATNEAGESYYTGDAPSCLVDQKNATRFVKYNILLGNLPGSVDYFISTGGSGGGAHAAMFAATSNNPDFYDYEIEAGAVGVSKNEDGSYSTTVMIHDTEYEISDGAWGSIAYSAITSLKEADMAMAFEYYMDTTYEFNTPFQAQVAEYLSESYMTYINEQNLSVKESAVGFDLNEDNDTKDEVKLTIEYDKNSYADTNGYYGTYLNLYLNEFKQNLQWYLDNLDYANDYTWFSEDGTAMSDEAAAAMSAEDKVTAFLAGRYAKGSSDDRRGGRPGGGRPSGEKPEGEFPEDLEALEGTKRPEGMEATDNTTQDSGNAAEVGTPDQGSTQASDSDTNSTNYSSYEDMLKAYQDDIDEISAGDEYGNNIVSLYDPLSYIGAEETDAPAWTKIIMGAAEGDMSMFSSLNLQIAWLNAGTDASIEWQWDGGHVPSEVLGDSFSLYVDQMYGKYVDGAKKIEKSAAAKQTANGTATEASGKNISSWVTLNESGLVSFSLKDAAAYRTAGASKATPGFDVIDYGQEDYVFGNDDADARHWNSYLLNIFEKYQDVLEPLFK